MEKDEFIERLFGELLEGQEKKLMRVAELLIPNITIEDILQPNDYPVLENHPHFRYEEGVLEGLRTAYMAIRAESACSKAERLLI